MNTGMKHSSWSVAIILILCCLVHYQPLFAAASPSSRDWHGPAAAQTSQAKSQAAVVTTFDGLVDALRSESGLETLLVGVPIQLTGTLVVGRNVVIRGERTKDDSPPVLTCSPDEPAFTVSNGGQLLLEDLSIQNCSKGVAAVSGPGSTLQLLHVQLTEHTLQGQAPLLSIQKGGSALLEGCNVSTNTFSDDSSLFYLDARGGSSLYIHKSSDAGATISGNNGGVLVNAAAGQGQARGRVELEDCQIHGNSVRAVVEAQSTELSLSGVKMVANKVASSAVLASECTTRITGLMALGNEADESFVSVQQGELHLMNSTLSNNTAEASLVGVNQADAQLGGVQLLHNTAMTLVHVEDGSLTISGDVNILRSNWVSSLVTASSSQLQLHNTLLLSNLALQDGWGTLMNATSSYLTMDNVIARKNGASVGFSLSRCVVAMSNFTMEDNTLHPATGWLIRKLGAVEVGAELEPRLADLARHGIGLVVYEAKVLMAESCVFKNGHGLQVLLWQHAKADLSWNDLAVLNIVEGGGMLGVLGSASLKINGSSWEAVQAGQPALELHGGDTAVTHSSFVQNTADVGGAISCTSTSADSPAVLWLTYTSFSGNQASSQGGALSSKGCQVEVEDVKFSDNSSPRGGAFACDSCSAHFIDTAFESNSAKISAPGHGGAISAWGAVDLSIEDCLFKENIAKDGGALAATADGGYNSSGFLGLFDSELQGNSASHEGGALWLSPDSATKVLLVNNVVLGNTASAPGPVHTINPSRVQLCCHDADYCSDYTPSGCPMWQDAQKSGSTGVQSRSAGKDETKDLGLSVLTAGGCRVGETEKQEDGVCMMCGTASYTVNPKTECKKCPKNAVCTKGVFTPADGWWTSDPLSDNVHQCILKPGCSFRSKRWRSVTQGNRTMALTQYIQNRSLALIDQASSNASRSTDADWMDLQCRKGYQGRLCSVCDRAAEFGRWMNACTRCRPHWAYVLQVLFAVLFVANLLWQEMYGHLSAVFTTRAAYYNSAPQEQASSPLMASIETPVQKQGKNWVGCKIIKVMVSYVQVLSLLKYTNLQLPKGQLGAIFNSAIWLIDFTSPYTWFPLDCELPGLPTVAVTRVIFPLLLMVALIFFFCCVWVLVCLRKRQTRHPEINLRNYILPRCCMSSMHIVWFFYPAATAAVLSIFNCVDVTGPLASAVYSLKMRPQKGLFWVEDLEMKCYEGSHRTLLLLAGIPGLLFITAGYPLLLTFILVSHRSKLALKRTLIKYGFLYEEYHKGMYLWDLVVTVRKLLLVAVFVLLRHYANATAQLAAAEAVVLAAVVTQVGVRPFRYQLFNVMEALTLLAGALTFNVLLFDTIGAGFNETSRTAWTIIAIIANGLILIYYLGMAIWVDVMYRSTTSFSDAFSDVSSDNGDPPENSFQRAVRKVLAAVNIRRNARGRGNGHLPGNGPSVRSMPYQWGVPPFRGADPGGLSASGLHHNSVLFDSISLQSSAGLGYQQEEGVLEVTEHYDADLDEIFDQSMLYENPQAGASSSPIK